MSEEMIKNLIVRLNHNCSNACLNDASSCICTVNDIKDLIHLYNKEKEKNKELENCLQMAKQIMTADISEDFDCMKLKEFKEYLLNEIKLNENFEE